MPDDITQNGTESIDASASDMVSTQSDNPGKEGKMSNKLKKFLPKSKRDALFLEEVRKFQQTKHLRGFRINIRATNGETRVISDANGQLIVANIVFPVIEAELKNGEYSIAISYDLRRNDEAKLTEHLNQVFGKDLYLHRNQDENKVTVTFIRTGEGWRTQFRKFFTEEGPAGYKRAKTFWHTSPTYREYAKVVYDFELPLEDKDPDTCYVLVLEGGFKQKRDGYMVVNTQALKTFNGPNSDWTYDTARVEVPGYHYKGDCLALDLGEHGPDLVVHEDNIKDEFGLLPELDGLMISMNPKKQYKTARTSPQHDNAFSFLMDQEHRELSGYTYYEVAAQEQLGRKLAETVLGHNTWIGMAIDNETEDLKKREKRTAQVFEYNNVAELVMDRMGTIIGVPHLVLKSIEMAKRQISRFGKDIKVEIPGAKMVSMRSTAILERAGLPIPEGNTISLSKWGSHIPDEILHAVLESTGGSDFDDTWTLILVELTDDHTFYGYEFEKGEVVFLMYRYPMGQRVHEGKVGVEYWMSHIADDHITQKHLKRIQPKYGRKPMLLDPAKLPTHVLELPEPEVTEPTSGTLEFMEQAEQSMQLTGLYDRVANGLGLLTHLASMNDWELHSDFTLPFSSEFLIDVPTKTFGGDDLRDIETLIDVLNNVLHTELRAQAKDDNGRPMVGAEFLRRMRFNNRKGAYNEVATWVFDKQAAAYGRTAQRVEVQLNIFARAYKAAWATLAPEGNLHSKSSTPSKIGTALINKIKDVQAQFAQSGRLSTKDYLPSYTRVAEIIRPKVETKHIQGLFRLQGNLTAWANETNLIGHVLFNSVMAETTLDAITEDDSWMQELLDQGIYNQVLNTMTDTPRDQEIARVFLRTIWGKAHNTTLNQSHIDYVVNRFSGKVTIEDLESVADTVTVDAKVEEGLEEPQEEVKSMSLAELADQLADQDWGGHF